ncbi:MAG: hypothetical protein ACF8XB_02585 [Planctomycetota bacterium JB042]
MRPIVSLALSLTLFAAAPASAAPPQFLGVGDIATAGNAELWIMAADGVTSNGHPLTGIAPSTSLWDPEQPDSFILGQGGGASNSGSLRRVTFTAPGQATPSLVAPTGSFGRPVQLSWDQTGAGIVVVTDWDQVHRVDAATGATTHLTTGAQPWGSNVTAGVMDRLTGDVYVGTGGGDVWRLVKGASGATLWATGLGEIRKLLVDTNASPHYLYVASADRFHRVALGGTPQPEAYFGTTFTPSSPGNIQAADFDPNGYILLGNQFDFVWRLPNPATVPATGVQPVQVGQYGFTSGSVWIRDLAVVGSTSEPFRLTFESVPTLAAKIEIENAPGPIGVGFLFLSTSTFLPAESGPFFGLMPDALTLAVLNLSPTPGGLLVFTGSAPAPLVTPSLTMAPFFGQTWDAVSVVFSPEGKLLGKSNLVRVTWQQ